MAQTVAQAGTAVAHTEAAVAQPGTAVAVFDLDGTITRFDTLAPFLFACLWRRPWRLVRLPLALPALLAFPIRRDSGALKGALLHALLGGMTRKPLERAADGFIAWLTRRGIYRQALQAIETHRARGERLVLMSASTQLYVPRIAQVLGFAETLCTPLRWREDGRLDGRLAGANCCGEEKRRRLAALIERERPVHVYAYGNSRADLPHLQLAEQAYLVNGPTRLQAPRPMQRLRWRY